MDEVKISSWRGAGATRAHRRKRTGNNKKVISENSPRVLQGAVGQEDSGLKSTQARFSNAELLQCFVTAPISDRRSRGILLPPMLMPQVHVNVGEHGGKPIKTRILEAVCSSLQPTRRVGRGDPLVTAHELCVATDKALRYCVPGSGQSLKGTVGIPQALFTAPYKT